MENDRLIAEKDAIFPAGSRRNMPRHLPLVLGWLCPHLLLLGWGLNTVTLAESELPLTYKSESILLMELWLLLLTFPSGFLCVLLIGSMAWAFPRLYAATLGELTTVSVFLTWLLFASSGYLQWFQLVPWVRKKFARRLRPGDGSGGMC
jgi:hypothetical protein